MQRNQVIALVSVGASSLAGGVLIGYKIAEKRMMSAFDDFMNDEFRRSQEARKLTVPEVIEAVNAELGVTIDPDAIVQQLPQPEPEVDNVVNIFDPPVDTDWDYEIERNTRSNKPIYIIHRDEFFNEESGLKQGQLSWYAGDGVLADELSHPIYNHTDIIGDCLQFGHGSNDPNVVYIRNETQRMEWEVCLDLGRYDVEVLGADVEDVYQSQDLKHSALRRFPSDY